MAQEFLPLCDVLFNIISLAAYFCDVVFDLVTVCTLYQQKEQLWFAVTLSFVLGSLIVCQVTSFRWHVHQTQPRCSWSLALLTIAHALQLGVLWRYFKLFVPVDLGQVKEEVRDLCMLRLMHAFGEAIPMLLVQLYLIWQSASSTDVTQLNIVSTALSLFSVGWALASFNKQVRRRHMHKLVLTWLGVVSQFAWRLGTISSRVVALTVYATLYQSWTFLVLALHWLCMFLWLMSPKAVFHGEKLSAIKKTSAAALIGLVYVFCYVNFQETNARPKMIAFYVTMFLENSLLLAVWLGQRPLYMWFEPLAISAVWGGFLFGIGFMVLYYSCFHIRRMNYGDNWASSLASQSTGSERNIQSSNGFSDVYVNDGMRVPTGMYKTHASGQFMNGGLHAANGVAYVPGVFNCRLNPALKRKKKKPTSFVPPPMVGHVGVGVREGISVKATQPFWRRPAPGSSDHEGSVGSRINIQQKLQEKKQQQLQELKEIEEEIKQGKIARPHPMEISDQGTLHQPIPRAKKQPWLKPEPPHPHPHPSSRQQLQHQQPFPHKIRARHRSKTPEVLLAPRYLDNCRVYYDYGDQRWKLGPLMSYGAPWPEPPPSSRHRDRHVVMYKSYRIPSDLDSQISLPRSYTLPREFRYYRKARPRKTVRSEHFVTSTNSSDGDVDSGDDNELDVNRELTGCLPSPYGWSVTGHRGVSTHNQHETQL